jgi:prevent-host-death family protein
MWLLEEEMNVPLSEAKAQLTNLVRRAEAGEEIILTRFGHAVARIAPVKVKQTPAESLAIIREIQASARGKITPGPDAAHSQDFLYNESGMPG